MDSTTSRCLRFEVSYCRASQSLDLGACLEVLEPSLLAGLNFSEMRKRVQKDRLIFRFGDAAWAAVGLDPRDAPFYILLPLLRADERDHFLFCMRAVADANKRQLQQTT